MTVGDLGEFELIARIARIAGRPGAGVVRGIGDDAALLRVGPREDLVLSTDALVEDVHFRWSAERPRTLGRRALAAALSDLAAMGARARGCLLALAAPARLPLRPMLDVVRGLVAAGRRHGCPLLGGNVTAAAQTSLTLTVAGVVARGRALRRDAARPGDRILVTGTLGGGTLARLRAERGGPPRGAPEPRLRAGRALAGLAGVGACIDVSDGLLAELEHVLEASGVGAEVDAARVPRPRGFEAGCGRLGVDPLELLLAGGEDYELLFTLRERAASGRALGARLGVAVREIGVVTRQRGLRLRGVAERPGRRGWRHFRAPAASSSGGSAEGR